MEGNCSDSSIESLCFEYRYLFSATNFLHLYIQQCCIHLPKEKPEFRNLPEDWVGDPGLLPETQVILTPG